MKRVLKPMVIVMFSLAFALSVSSCNFFAGIFDPSVGTWMGGVQGITLTLQLNGDKTFSEVMIDVSGNQEMAVTGTYTVDSTAHTLKTVVKTYTSNGADQAVSSLPGIGTDNSITVSFTVDGDVATMSGASMPAGTYMLLRI